MMYEYPKSVLTRSLDGLLDDLGRRKETTNMLAERLDASAQAEADLLNNIASLRQALACLPST